MNISTIEYYWDDQEGVTPGWFARAKNNENEVVTDSMKIGFPLDLELYDHNEENELMDALKDEFPEAEIVAL
jgi:hypothetical protein